MSVEITVRDQLRSLRRQRDELLRRNRRRPLRTEAKRTRREHQRSDDLQRILREIAELEAKLEREGVEG